MEPSAFLSFFFDLSRDAVGSTVRSLLLLLRGLVVASLRAVLGSVRGQELVKHLGLTELEVARSDTSVV